MKCATISSCMARQRLRELPASTTTECRSTIINYYLKVDLLHNRRTTALPLVHVRSFCAHIWLVMTTAEKAATPNALVSPQTAAVPTLVSPSTTSSNASSKSSPATYKWHKLLSILTYTPKRCRYDPAKPPRFSLPLNLLFSFAATFTGTGIEAFWAK